MKVENSTSSPLFLCLLLTSDEINKKDSDNNFVLPKLPYEPDALEPYIGAMTIEYHFGKHLAAYITNTNNLKKDTPFEDSDLIDIVKGSTGGLFNNAAQVFNHIFYFESLQSYDPMKDKPTGELLEMINQNFGSFDAFKDEFAKAGATLFGSGWVWLTVSKDGKMEIIQTQNADTPLCHGKYPILTMDVWEHAYYLDTQNARPKYIENYFKVINWDAVAKRLAK